MVAKTTVGKKSGRDFDWTPNGIHHGREPAHLKLDYLPPDQQRRKQWLLPIYFFSLIMGSIAAGIIVGLMTITWDAMKPRPPDPSEISLILICMIFGIFALVGSFAASFIFRLCCGWVLRATRRWIVTVGALNGLIGMGIFVGSGMLMDRHVLSDSQVNWNIIIGTNIALPVIMGIITANKPTY